VEGKGGVDKGWEGDGPHSDFQKSVPVEITDTWVFNIRAKTVLHNSNRV